MFVLYTPIYRFTKEKPNKSIHEEKRGGKTGAPNVHGKVVVIFGGKVLLVNIFSKNTH